MEKTAPVVSDQSANFAATQRDIVYDVIFKRRDVRAAFKSDPIDEAQLARILLAAHHAPSVGFLQPWNFILINKDEQRRAVHALFKKANDEASEMFEGEQRNLYQSLKLEGLLNAPLHICVTCDRNRAGPVVLGRTHMLEMDVYSTVCAVQNLWLAARAENIGVGWVSIFHEDDVKNLLSIPKEIELIAYLTVGYVESFSESPDLAQKGWRKRLNLADLIMENSWETKPSSNIKNAVNAALSHFDPDKQSNTK